MQLAHSTPEVFVYHMFVSNIFCVNSTKKCIQVYDSLNESKYSQICFCMNCPFKKIADMTSVEQYDSTGTVRKPAQLNMFTKKTLPVNQHGLRTF